MAGDANLSLHESLDFERHAVGFGFANKLSVDLEDAQFHNALRYRDVKLDM